MARVMPKPVERPTAPATTADPPKRRRGRPSKAETAARQTAPVVAAPTAPSNLYEVVRPIRRGGGISEPIGKILDATDWPVGRAKQLVSQRYLKPAGS